MKEAPIIFFRNRDDAPIPPPPAIMAALEKRMQILVRVPEYDKDGETAWEVRSLIEGMLEGEGQAGAGRGPA